MKKPLLLATLLLTVMAIFTTCKKDLPIEPTAPVDNYDKDAMLQHWADNLIIPGHKAYNTTIKTLNTQAHAFVDDPDLTKLEAVRTAWLESYIAWQNLPYSPPYVWIYEEFEDLDSLTLLYPITNSYPTGMGTFDFLATSPDFDQMSKAKKILGFPALEFMLYGLADTDSDILYYYSEPNLAKERYQQILLFLTNKLQWLSDASIYKWTNNYREKFLMESHYHCANQVINDFVYFFNLELLSKKVSNPCGLRIGHEKAPDKSLVEAPYSRIYSKTLLLEALNTAQDFYNGVPFGGSFEDRSNSIYQYLDYLDAKKNGERLCDLINEQFDKGRAEIDKLEDDLGSEIENNIEQLIIVHKQLEEVSILLEYDMIQAIGMSRLSVFQTCL